MEGQRFYNNGINPWTQPALANLLVQTSTTKVFLMKWPKEKMEMSTDVLTAPTVDLDYIRMQLDYLSGTLDQLE
ncbi:Uncharacterized protein DAT39_010364, partial [Clarias magur]